MLTLRLTIIAGGPRLEGFVYEADRDVVGVGRAQDNALTLDCPTVSGHHARFVVGSEKVLVEELESAYGTRVLRDGERREVSALHPLALETGDIVELGEASDAGARLEVDIAEVAGDRVVEIRPLATLSGVTRSAEQNALLLSELQRAQQSIAIAPNLEGAIASVADAALSLVKRATHATILLKDGERAGLDAYVPILTRVRGPRDPAATPRPVPVTRGVVRKVLRDRAAVLAADASSETVASESLLSSGIRSTIGVPLWRGEEIIGVLQVDNRDAASMFQPLDVEVLGALAANASLAVSNARLIQRLAAAEERLARENAFLRDRERERRPRNLIGDSVAMLALLEQLDRVAATKATVLIEGETGVGKERVAALLHEHSDRASALLVVQNCAAIPENLLESELFGHRRGAFTGADKDKKGLFEIADGGTLFLDEIGELPLTLQPKLLRVLQEGEVRRVGDELTRKVDVRVVAATNRDLEREATSGRFREDLYYRLSVFPLRVPSLRDRKSDIPLLAEYFLERYTREMGKAVAGFSQAAMELLLGHDWPGNVRELENEVQRLVIQADAGDFIGPDLLSPRVRRMDDMTTRAGAATGPLKERVAQMERYLISEELRRCDGNKTQAAKALGITREGLHKKLRTLGL